MRALIIAAVVALLPLAALAGDTNLPGRLIVQTDDSAPTCSTASSAGTLCVEGAVELQSTAAIAGATTLTGAVTAASTLAVTGTSTLTGAVTLGGNLDASGGQIFGQLNTFEDKTTNYTVDGDDCGDALSSNDDTHTFTLPDTAAGNKGCIVTMTNTAADDATLMSVSPHSSDGIFGGCCGLDDSATTTCVHFTGTVDKDLQNTKATQNKGDFVSVISDGSTGWYVLACHGIWASQS